MKDACLLFPITKPPLMFLSPRSGGRALQQKGSSLHLKASSDIMEKPDTLSGVGERQKDYCCSLVIHRCFYFFAFFAKAVYFKLAFVVFTLFLHLTHYMNSSSNQ